MQTSAVAKNTKLIIARKGLKQYVVAQKAGFSDKQFSALLNGRKVIKDRDIVAIANALEVTPNDLFDITTQTSAQGKKTHKEVI